MIYANLVELKKKKEREKKDEEHFQVMKIDIGREKIQIDHLPVAPNAFPLGNSHIPAMNCARPPQNTAMPTTAFGAAMLRAPALNRDRINVVDAKENSPLDGYQLLVIETAKETRGRTDNRGWRSSKSLVK
jgi:hypothetical protein